MIATFAALCSYMNGLHKCDSCNCCSLDVFKVFFLTLLMPPNCAALMYFIHVIVLCSVVSISIVPPATVRRLV